MARPPTARGPALPIAGGTGEEDNPITCTCGEVAVLLTVRREDSENKGGWGEEEGRGWRVEGGGKEEREEGGQPFYSKNHPMFCVFQGGSFTNARIRRGQGAISFCGQTKPHRPLTPTIQTGGTSQLQLDSLVFCPRSNTDQEARPKEEVQPLPRGYQW